jgi:PAS domain S-box-containing protein
MDAVIVVNAEQRIVLFNPAAEQMFGCVSSDVVGSSLDRFIPQHHRSVHRTHIKDFGKTGTTTRRMGALGALSGVRSNGAEFPIEASISQLETDGEKLFTVILRDISERKLAEAESEKAFAREQELREAEEEANRLKDEFLAIMSHELRNPLNVILGYSELFLLSEEIKQSPQLRRMAEALKRNALTQSRLIRDLLDLSRLRSGKISLSMEAVSLLTTIKNAVETVSSDADAKAIGSKSPRRRSCYSSTAIPCDWSRSYGT